jgi:hypothetical protein
VSLAAAPTKAIPSLSAMRASSSAPTTPLPRAGMPPTTPVPAAAKHSVAGTIFLWLLIVGSVVGGGGFYAYRRGWLLAATGRPDSLAAALPAESVNTHPADSSKPASDTSAVASRAPDTAHAAPPAPGTPGKLSLQGIPAGARVMLNGQPVRGSKLDVPPGVYKLTVEAVGYDPYERQVVMTPAGTSTVKVEMQLVGESSGGGPCDQYGPAYNQDNLCFDTRPIPLSSTVIPIPADAPVFPRDAILLFHVARTGETLETRLFGRSNVETFNDQALDISKNLRWNPAQKNGEPVDAWVQWPFKPVRQ